MHGVYLYPCPYDNVNLSRLLYLKKHTSRFGYSGHALGIWDAVAAISIGAEVVEKHFTIDNNLDFKDNKFSILPEDLASIRNFSELFSKMNIECGLDFQEKEKEIRETYFGRWDCI